MSATATKVPLAQAIAHAAAFRAQFAGCARRWEIAGSIRRKRAAVGDIEHVVIPRWTECGDDRPDDPFFGGFGPQFNCVREMVDSLLSRGTFKLAVYPDGKHRNGDKYIGLEWRDVRHEIFMAEEDNWGPMLAIRTGSAEFSRGLMVRLRRHNHQQKDGRLHRIERFPDGLGGVTEQLVPINCPTEELYFAHARLNVADWPPERREGVPS